jgi:DNA-binding XRE family transcriptional regulator
MFDSTTMARTKDLLDQLIAERAAKNPRYAALVAAAYEQRELGFMLAQRRRRAGLSQTDAAAKIGSTQRIISKIENGGDVNVSTLRRYMGALGLTLRLARASEERRPRRRSSRTAR